MLVPSYFLSSFLLSFCFPAELFRAGAAGTALLLHWEAWVVMYARLERAKECAQHEGRKSNKAAAVEYKVLILVLGGAQT